MEGEPRAPGRRPPRTRLQPAVKQGALQDLQHARKTGLNGRFSARKAAGGADGKSAAGRMSTSQAWDARPPRVELQAQGISRRSALSTNER
jgi:hypothetical protein